MNRIIFHNLFNKIYIFFNNRKKSKFKPILCSDMLKINIVVAKPDHIFPYILLNI
jgi:hypothetical protein